jgi:hypothetical protein
MLKLFSVVRRFLILATNWTFQMSVSNKLEIGDVFEVPLSDGRHAYAQYVQQNSELGYLITL